MKSRTDVIAQAARDFVSRLPRKPMPQTLVSNFLPETTAELAEVLPFQQKTVTPRNISKVLCSTIIERVLAGRATALESVGYLTGTERDYVLGVLDEVTKWASDQGFEVRS